MLIKFLKELYKTSTTKLIYCFSLMLSVSLLEGAGILIIIPLLELMNGNDKLSTHPWISNFIHSLGINFSLPLILIIYILIGGISAIAAKEQTILANKIQQNFSNHLSVRLFSAISLAKWQYLITRSKADFSNSLTNELSRVNTGTALFLQLITGIAITIIQLAISLFIAPKLTLLVAVCGVIIFGFFYRFTREAKKIGTNLLFDNQKLMFHITEHLNGIKEIKSYGLQTQELVKFNDLRESVSDHITQSVIVQSKLSFLYKIIALLMISSVFFIAMQIYHTPLSTMMVLLFVFAKIWPRITSINNLLAYVAGMLPAFKNLIDIENELIKEQSQITQETTTRFTLQHKIEFKQVYFRHQNTETYTLNDISFSIQRGTTTAIVGFSGAGKSTIADLLIGLLIPDKGSVLIDGQNLHANISSWCQTIAYVPQDAFIFNDTVRNNLCWSYPDATNEEIWQVLQMVLLSDLVQQLPLGLDTLVGDRGVMLSGGEKQRLILARALLRNPDVLILDEATSSLDNQNERSIQQVLDGYYGKISMCIIAHRLTTVAHADQIIVLKHGKIVEIGTYKSLIENKDSHFHHLHNASLNNYKE